MQPATNIAALSGINDASFAAGKTKSAIRELAAWGAARKAAIGAENVFDFSIGNPSVPAPDCVKASIEKNLTISPLALHGYTAAPGLPEARAAVAASLNRRFDTAYHADDLYLTCGAAASVSIALQSCVRAGDEVIVIAPYFPEYRVWIEAAGATCVEVLADAATFHLDINAIDRAITPRTKALIIDSPNNPVGVIYSAQELQELQNLLCAAQTRTGNPIMVISDEPYRELTYGDTVPWVPNIISHALVCYSYSKSLSLPGERIGWVLVPPTNPLHDVLVYAVAGAGRRLGFVCAPALFQRVLIDCVDAPAPVAAYAKNRAALCEILDDCKLSYVTPQGAFYLWMKSPIADAAEFSNRARAHELLLVPSDSFGVPGWLRLGYCAPYDMIVRSRTAFEQL